MFRQYTRARSDRSRSIMLRVIVLPGIISCLDGGLTMVENQVFDIAHDLRIALVRVSGHSVEALAGFM